MYQNDKSRYKVAKKINKKTVYVIDIKARKILDDEIYEEFKKLEINPFGEMGEFHSTLLDLDIFEFPIKYDIKSIYKCEDKFGEKWEINANYSK